MLVLPYNQFTKTDFFLTDTGVALVDGRDNSMHTTKGDAPSPIKIDDAKNEINEENEPKEALKMQNPTTFSTHDANNTSTKSD